MNIRRARVQIRACVVKSTGAKTKGTTPVPHSHIAVTVGFVVQLLELNIGVLRTVFDLPRSDFLGRAGV